MAVGYLQDQSLLDPPLWSGGTKLPSCSRTPGLLLPGGPSPRGPSPQCPTPEELVRGLLQAALPARSISLPGKLALTVVSNGH